MGNLISLAGLMNTMGLPNDFLAGSINPLSILILLPLFERVIYPSLRRVNIPFRPISRITFGFVIMSGAIAVAAGLQSLAYNSPPYSVSTSPSDGSSQSLTYVGKFPIYSPHLRLDSAV